MRVLLVLVCFSLLAGCVNRGFRPVPVHDRSIHKQREAQPAEPSRTAAEPAATPEYYTVSQGDTLYSIAVRHDVNYLDLARWNGIGPPYTIYPGQRLGITAQSGAFSADTQARSVPAPPAGNRDAVPGNVTARTTSDRPAATTTIARPDVGASRPIGGSSAGRTTTNPPPAATATAPTARPVAVTPPPATTQPASTRSGARSRGGVNWLWPLAGGRVNRGFVDGETNRQGLDIGGTPGQPVLAAADGTVVYSGPGLTGYAELVIIKHNDQLLSAYGHNRRRLVSEGENVTSGQQIAELGRSPRGEDELHFQIRRLGKPQDPQDYLPRQ